MDAAWFNGCGVYSNYALFAIVRAFIWLRRD